MPLVPQPPDRLDAVAARHPQVHEDHVRPQPVVRIRLLGPAALAVGVGTGRVGVTLAAVVMLLVAATGAVQRRHRPDDRR